MKSLNSLLKIQRKKRTEENKDKQVKEVVRFVLKTNLTQFLMRLFHFSTCFEQHSAHHQENQLYQYIIWYLPLCVSGRLVRSSSLTCIPDGHLHRVIYTRWCIDAIDSLDDERSVARNMWRSEINTLKIASSWLLTRIAQRCTFNKI
jgi:hypothetical protein